MVAIVMMHTDLTGGKARDVLWEDGITFEEATGIIAYTMKWRWWWWWLACRLFNDAVWIAEVISVELLSN
jgi:hypothetical protein